MNAGDRKIEAENTGLDSMKPTNPDNFQYYPKIYKFKLGI